MGRTASSTIRVLLVLLDLVALLFGVALLGLALYLYLGQHFSQLSASRNRAPIVLFVVMGTGAVITLVSSVGLTGAIRRSHRCLSLYAVLFCIIIAVQCMTILFVYIFKPNVKLFIERALDELLAAYKATPRRDMGTALDFVQSLCRCCGVTGFVDFFPGMSLPMSCCAHARADNILVCSVAILQDGVPGCKQRFLDVLYGPTMPITLGAFGGVVFLEILLIVMACYLCCRIRRERA